ncbi:MAG: hypothetical protein AAGA48_24860 [Myxococcota bacterium]
MLTLMIFAGLANADVPGTLILQKRGPLPVHAWVDAVSQGRVRTARKAVPLSLAAGTHEVWLTADGPGVVTLCRGLVDVPAKGAVTVELQAGLTGLSCRGLREGWPDGPTAFRGGFVDFRIDAAVDAWVSIDGGQPLAFPDAPFQLNLAPGSHTLVLFQDAVSGTVFDQGSVTLLPGQQLAVTCTRAGCVGFDAPPIFITEVYQHRDIVLATPGVAIDFSLQVGTSDASDIQIDLDVDVTE